MIQMDPKTQTERVCLCVRVCTIRTVRNNKNERLRYIKKEENFFKSVQTFLPFFLFLFRKGLNEKNLFFIYRHDFLTLVKPLKRCRYVFNYFQVLENTFF